jgi:peroxiredoxin Q/BCP
MRGYQAGIQKFEESGAQVFGISTDSVETLARWGRELKTAFPLLSDPGGKVAEAYGVLAPVVKMARRATFVIDGAGRIRHIEEGSQAIDPAGAAEACSRIRGK